MASTDHNQILWLCLPLRSARAEKTHRDFIWGAKRSLCFCFGVRNCQTDLEKQPTITVQDFFSLKNTHTTFLCRYCLHSPPHPWHGSFTPCLENWIQDSDPILWCPENGTAQALQTFHQGWGAFPLSVSWIHFMAPRENKMTPLVPSESRDFLPIQILMMC